MPVVNNLPRSGVSETDLLQINSDLSTPLDALIKSYLGTGAYTLNDIYNAINDVISTVTEKTAAQYSIYATHGADKLLSSVDYVSMYGSALNLDNIVDASASFEYPTSKLNVIHTFVAPLNGQYRIQVTGYVGGTSGDTRAVYIVTQPSDNTSASSLTPYRWKSNIISPVDQSSDTINGWTASCYAFAGETILVCAAGYYKSVGIHSVSVQYMPIKASV